MKRDYEKPVKIVAVCLVVVAVGAVAAYAGCRIKANSSIKKAEAELQKGYGALAAETVDNSRFMLHANEKNCRVLIASYYQARRLDRLEWATEACMESGQEIPDAYLGLSAAREMAGRDQEALQVLASAVQKFDKIPDIYYAVAQIMKRNKKEPETISAMLKASERATQNPQMQIEILQYLASLQKWDNAKEVANRVKDIKTDNPEIKLFLARTFVNAKDPQAALPLIAEAKELIAKAPAARAQELQKAYGDILTR